MVWIVAGLSNEAMKKLDAHYIFKSMAFRNFSTSELVSSKFCFIYNDTRKHLDQLDDLFDQLWTMSTVLDDSLAIGTFVGYMEVARLAPVTAAIKTFAERDLNWADASSELIKKARNMVMGSKSNQAPTVDHH